MTDAPAPRVGRAALLSAIAYMLQGAGLTLCDLAKHMGVKLEAAPITLPPKTEERDKLTPRELDVLKRIDTVAGATVGELMVDTGLSIQAITGYVCKLERLGRVVRVKANGVRSPRAFTDPVAAQAWADAQNQSTAAANSAAAAARQEKLAAEMRRTAEREAALADRRRQAEARHQQKLAAKKAEHAARAPKPRKAPTPAQNVTVHAKPSGGQKLAGPAVETAATVRKIDTTVRANNRIEAMPALPADPRWPSFSSTPLGINPQTGRAW